MDQVLDRLSRNASTMAQTIEDARRRTRAVGARLRGVGADEEEEGSGELLPESAAGETAPQSAGFL